MPVKPMLDDVELQHVQKVDAEDEQVLAQHGVPALEGDFLQDLGRRVTRLTLVGVMTGSEAQDQLKTLRLKFRNAEPVSFVSDIATATTVDKVIIEEFGVRELAGKPARFEFQFTLREFLPPPNPEQEEPPPLPEPQLPDVETGKLVVDVTVEGQPDFDFGKLTLTAESQQPDGSILSRTLVNRDNNIWTEEGLPPGLYKIKAVEFNPQPVVGSTQANVAPAQTAQASLTAQAGSLVAKQLIIHFRSDRAFIEPCMRAVLRQAVLHAKDASTEKLLIVGHTDKVDIPAYNQSLSERRARSVFAYVTFGRDRAASLAEWNLLRQTRPKKELPSVKDSWGVREYQYMLQDLGFYPGRTNGKENDLTREAVSAFRCKKGLPPGTNVDDDVWNALITDYLAQDNLAVEESQFFPNARDACNSGIVKWLGCGESDPVKNVEIAFGQSRRVELLFAQTAQLTCDISQPTTFDLPPSTSPDKPTWCLDPRKTGTPCCFVVPVLAPAGSTPKEGQLTRTPLEPGSISVEGLIKREDGKPLTTANRSLALITPTGEVLASEKSNGEPAPLVTKADGTFKFSDKPIGVYSVEIQDDVLIRLDTQKASDAKGNSVCKSLTSSDFSLNIIILPDPLLREIQLPVVIHLMTALHPTTRAIRTCSDIFTSGPPEPQQTKRTAQDVRELLDGANEVWRQGRVRFNLVDIVEEVYADSTRTECAVGETEFRTLIFNSSYPDSLNVYFFGTLETTGEAGLALEVDFTGVAGSVFGKGSACALGDKVRQSIFVNAPPILVEPDKETSITLLSHELGHLLSLGDLEENGGRLMLASIEAGNRKLIKEDVTQARKAPGTAHQCRPLSLRVTNATQVGGTRSVDFITFQGAAQVTIDALVDGSTTIDKGTVTMTGGTAGANPGQQTVATTSLGISEIVATYTPTGSTATVNSRVRIRVVTFDLTVQGAERIPGTTTFRTGRQPNQVATVIVQLSSVPFVVPKSLVTWSKGEEVPDPLRRAVPLGVIAQTIVTAKIGTTERNVTILVVEVLVTSNKDQLGAAIAQVQIEGILNKDLKDIDVGDLFNIQPDSLFRLRADIPGQPAAVTKMTATVTSTAPGGANIETISVTLTRTAVNGNSFLSLPLLAVPAIFTSAEINVKAPATLNVIRARAGGKLTLTVVSPVPIGNLGKTEVAVRGRVVFVAAQAFDGSGVSVADMRRHLGLAHRAWAQAGIEVKERSTRASVPDPGNLLELDHDVPFSGKLTTEEKRLTGVLPGGPTRSPTATDINVYYVDTIVGPAAGVTYSHEGFNEITDATQAALAIEIPSSITTSSDASDTILAHEMGHALLINWPGDEHADPTGKPWPDDVVLHGDVTVQKNLDREQVINIIRSTRVGNNPHVIFEP